MARTAAVARRTAAAGVALLLLGLLTGLPPARAATPALDRPADPVVLDGAATPRLVGAPPLAVVAYRYAGGWRSVPVQVDERARVGYDQIFQDQRYALPDRPLVYVDPRTYTGPDPDPTVDADDQIVFMARDAGSVAPAGTVAPPGTVRASATQVRIGDPLGGSGYVYLFRTTGAGPAPAPGYVTYDPVFVDGSYKQAYRSSQGRHPEASTVDTAYYHLGFADRWIRDELRLGSAAPDLLDRDKVLFTPGFCGRSEDTFSGYGTDPSSGAFIANIDGPVRAIRSYLGANSGIITQRDHVFYDRREDEVTNLRVHQIPGILSFLDWSAAAAAAGVTYQARATDGRLSPKVAVDGRPDALFGPDPRPATEPGPALTWELVTGTPGSVVRVSRLATQDLNTPPDDQGFVVRSFYEDDATSPTTQCTGDADALGASGIQVVPAPDSEPGPDLLPCTDPFRFGVANRNCPSSWNATFTLTLGYDRPGVAADPGTADAFTRRVVTPLTTTVRSG